jgi:hypothetical protein
MRLQIAGVLLAAMTVVGCSSNPPPPPPMAAMPEPAPAPPPPPPMPATATYRGPAALVSDAHGCRQLRGTQTAHLSNGVITVAGLRGRVGPDGAITGQNTTGHSISGHVEASLADVTVSRGHCTYHMTLNAA